MELNEKQRQIVETKEGQVLVVACPGSGKTTAMIARANALVKAGINPKNILAITFTKEAASGMQARYEKEYGKDGICFGTIHSICFHLLCNVEGYNKEDLLLETDKWAYFSSLLYKKVSVSDLEEYILSLIQEISYIKNKCLPPEVYEPEVTDKKTFIQLYHAYEEYKHAQGKIDFDDMLILTRDIFESRPEILKQYQMQYSYIMIDEYQDTNRVQADIFYMLAGDNGNLFVVGDDDQSIYGFRSADSSIMLDFPKKYPNCKTIYLDTNYRSCLDIIDRAAKLIEKNQVRFQKKFLGWQRGEATIRVDMCEDAVKQRESVFGRIKALHATGTPYEEIAILYRTNRQNLMYVQKFMKNDIPFYTTEAVKDYHKDFPFQDFMAYYRLAQGIAKRGDLQRILNRPCRYLKAENFKNCTFDLQEMLACCNGLTNEERAKDNIISMYHDITQLKNQEPESFLGYLFHIMGYRESALSFAEYCGRDKAETEEMIELLKEEGCSFPTMEAWEHYAQVYSKILQEKRKQKKGICLSTFHSSKGLEWDHCFLIDCNEDMTPFKKAESPDEMEEERRLFYVAVTRARKGLYFSFLDANGSKKMFPSRFLHEMELRPETKKYPVNSSGEFTKEQLKNIIGTRFYAVKKGRTPGIYHSWPECNKQVKDFRGAKYKRFDTYEEAEKFMQS